MKLAALYALFAGWLTYQAVQNVLIAIGIIATAIIGTGIIWQRAVRPAARALKRAGQAIDVIWALPAWQQRVDRRFDEGNGRMNEHTERLDTISGRQECVLRELEAHTARLGAIDGRFDVIAEAEKERVADALAGDRRMPAERRKHTP